MIWAFWSCAPKGWHDVDNFVFQEDGILDQNLSNWTGEGSMDPANYLTGFWQIQHEGCHIQIDIDDSMAYDSLGTNFAFALNITTTFETDDSCANYPADVAFASQDQIDMGFLWGDVLFWDGNAWQLYDMEFEQDTLNGPRNYEFVMSSFDQ